MLAFFGRANQAKRAAASKRTTGTAIRRNRRLDMTVPSSVDPDPARQEHLPVRQVVLDRLHELLEPLDFRLLLFVVPVLFRGRVLEEGGEGLHPDWRTTSQRRHSS